VALRALEEKPHGFLVLPRRWVVERTFAWLGQARRLAKDYERLPETGVAMIHWAMSRISCSAGSPVRQAEKLPKNASKRLRKAVLRPIAKQSLEGKFCELRVDVALGTSPLRGA